MMFSVNFICRLKNKYVKGEEVYVDASEKLNSRYNVSWRTFFWYASFLLIFKRV